MEAFLSATHISVQQVESVDEMRITNSDLKKKWTTLEKDMIEVSQLRLAAVNTSLLSATQLCTPIS